ncbi:MAG: FG-GAP-like repeat-containing protein, partial [Candidatus Methylomirabilis sp.]|nr:FG-GAP-like repeat-containing protein [Deltaproteobacteria bacterium]
CNGFDDDCDGVSDEGFDSDGDGWGSCLDCKDRDPAIHPEAPELCDGRDNDCDGLVDEDFPAEDTTDADGDRYTYCGGDCDDGDPWVNPSVHEVCNGIDDDCSGVVDDLHDSDGDGFGSCHYDCDRDDGTIYPGAPEVPDNGVDDDCDTVVDDRAELLYTIDTPRPSDAFATRLVGIGDVNADGAGDLLVLTEAYEYDPTLDALVPFPASVYSGADGSLLHEVRPEGTYSEGGAGYVYEATGLGDADGDGHADFVLAQATKTAYLTLYSGATGEAIRSWPKNGPPEFPWTYIGWIADAGDVDGDGVRDLVAEAHNSGLYIRGIAVFSGASGEILWTWVPPVEAGPRPAGEFLGGPDVKRDGLLDGELHGGRDVTGDGAPDVVYVVPNRTGSGRRITILSGPTGLPSSTFPIDRGRFLGLIADDGGDGLADFLIGSLSEVGSDPLPARIVSSSDGAVLHDVKCNYEYCGGEGVVVPDLDGDESDDVLLNMNFDGRSGVLAASGQTGRFLAAVQAEQVGWGGYDDTKDDFGDGLAGLGDIDGDGKGEFAVSAPQRNLTPELDYPDTRVGRVYVYSLRIPCEDRDGDGYRTASCGDAGTDCDDGDASVHP